MGLTPEQNELVLRHLGYAEGVARSIAKSMPLADIGLTIEDCVQQGVVGLMQAAARFNATDHDPSIASLDTRFKSYAYLRIRGAVIDECRRYSIQPRGQEEKPIVLSFDYTGGENLSSVEDNRDDWIDLQAALAEMSQTDRELAVGLLSGMTLKDLAARLNLTNNQIQADARRVRQMLEGANSGDTQL